MAVPPPPMPPGPPPPPIGGLNLKASKGNAPAGDARSALLQSIQKGTKLKKATTVDKSGPALSGKVCDSSSNGPSTRSNNATSKSNSNANSSVNNSTMGNGAPKLGGLFEGLASMPKLKPVNGSRASPIQRQNDASAATNKRDGSPPTTITSSNNNNNNNNNNNSPMDFNSELTKHLTLKRQKQQINATEANLKTNRGPPPQPPIATKNLANSTSDSVLEKPKTGMNARSSPLLKDNPKASSPTLSENSTTGSIKTGSVKDKASNLNLSLGNNFVNNLKSQSKSTTQNATSTKTTTMTTKTTISKQFKTNSQNQSQSQSNKTTLSMSTINSGLSVQNVSPNKSSLFGGTSSTPIPTTPNGSSCESPPPPLPPPNDLSKSPLPGNKPMPNHGKPNFAPKPPGLQRLNLATNGQRPIVARHHSMKSPRSPPISAGGVSPFPQQHFGTMRTPLQLYQSQDGINMRTAPNPPIGRPTVAPPKPPTVKPPPPPTPARSISNSNLTNAQNSTPTSPSSSTPTNTATQNSAHSTPATQSPSSVSSLSNVYAQREQNRIGSNMESTSASVSPIVTTNLKSNGSPVQKTSSSREKAPLPIILNGGSIIAPPLPPHRTCPAPPPPQRQTSNGGSAAPPVPPQRHSSIRGSAPLTPLNSSSSINFGNSMNNVNSVSRLVIDLETKFGKRFHNVTEFPKPPPFLSIQKVYPSRTVKTTNVSKDNNNVEDTSIKSTNKILQPAFQPMKKHRAPAPPPQAGVAAATASVIRQSSFLYGSGQTQSNQTVDALSVIESTRNSTIY